MGTPTAAFITAATTRVQTLLGPRRMADLTAQRDTSATSEDEDVTAVVVEGAAYEVASALGDLESTDKRAIDLTARLAIVRFSGEFSATYNSEQQASEVRVIEAIDAERLRRIHAVTAPSNTESVYRPRSDYSTQHPTNTIFTDD